MRSVIRIFLLATCFPGFLVVKGQADSVLYQKDSVVEIEQDCTTSFFKRSDKIAMPAKTILVLKNSKTVSLAGFVKTNDAGSSSEQGFIDLDGDGKKELVISGFTGGAHCCDEIYVFRNIGPNKYQHVAKLFAGNTCITADNEFLYDFYEQFGYFFTCFACSYEDTSDTAPLPIHSIVLKYSKGRMILTALDKELKSKLNDNLAKLGEQPYEKPEDNIAQDNGLRKEFAMNLAVYYYSFGRNLAETQRLFNKYYKYPDAKKVWAAFAKQVQYMRKDNDF